MEQINEQKPEQKIGQKQAWIQKMWAEGWIQFAMVAVLTVAVIYVGQMEVAEASTPSIAFLEMMPF